MADAVSVPAPVDGQGNPTTNVGQQPGVQTYTPPTQETGPDAPKVDAPAAPPEGYTSWEDYGKAVAAGTAKAPEPAKVEPTEEEAQAAAIKTAVEATTAGMAPEMAAKVTPFVEAYAKNGTLTDAEVTQAAQAVGLSEAMVRQYMAGAEVETIKGVQAENAIVGKFHTAFEGAEGYQQFQEWAAGGGLTPEETKTLNGLLDSNPEAALALASSYKTRMQEQGLGKPARDLTRGVDTGQAKDADTFGSMAEQVAAQSDPRYASDPAYRQQVSDKIARSTAY